MKRARDGTRTRDPDLGKVVLYQLSYFRSRCCFAFASAKIEQIFYSRKFFGKKIRKKSPESFC